MSVLLKIDNFAISNRREKTYLNADADVGASQVTIKSNQNIIAQLYALIGTRARENTELKAITAVSSSALTLGTTLVREHKKYTDVLVLNANQIQVYRAANVDGTVPKDADFSTLGSPFDIDYDEKITRFTDPDGGSGFWYKYTFYNSTTATETDLAESLAVRGGSVTDYASVREIRQEAGIENNPYLSDVYIAGLRSQAQSVINAALKGSYTVPFNFPIPSIVTRMTVLLTAGYILKREFGDAAVGTNADGQQKIDEVLRKDPDNPGLLQQIINGTLIIVSDTGGEAASTTQRITGWPNKSTATTPVSEGGAKRKFRAGMEF